MSQESQRGGGNTKTPPRKISRSRTWCFTINNYDNSVIVSLDSLVSGSQRFIYGFEEGKSGTPHIQGYVQFKNQKRFTVLKKAIPTAHWEKAKGTPTDNFKYCSKDGNYKTNFAPKITRDDMKQMVAKTYENVIWHPWQRSVLDLVDAGPTHRSDRIIYWVYEPTGNVGKSFLAKYLALRPGTVICEGRKADIFNQVNTTIEGGVLPKFVLVDIPRVTLDFVSYTALECLKNGLLYSGKYEGGVCIFPSPVVLCFANEMPKLEKMSKDRWAIHIIKDNQLFQKLI